MTVAASRVIGSGYRGSGLEIGPSCAGRALTPSLWIVSSPSSRFLRRRLVVKSAVLQQSFVEEQFTREFGLELPAELPTEFTACVRYPGMWMDPVQYDVILIDLFVGIGIVVETDFVPFLIFSRKRE